MSRPLFSGKPCSGAQALKRSKPQCLTRSRNGGIDRELKRAVDHGWRAFWARRGRDVDSFGFSGGFAG